MEQLQETETAVAILQSEKVTAKTRIHALEEQAARCEEYKKRASDLSTLMTEKESDLREQLATANARIAELTQKTTADEIRLKTLNQTLQGAQTSAALESASRREKDALVVDLEAMKRKYVDANQRAKDFAALEGRKSRLQIEYACQRSRQSIVKDSRTNMFAFTVDMTIC